jgi:hypothetical protein
MSGSSVVSMDASSSPAAAAAAAAPASVDVAFADGATVLLMRGQSRPFHVRLPRAGLPAPFLLARKLLKENPTLCQALGVTVCADGVYTVKDYALRDAQMLMRLGEWLHTDAQAPPRLRVAILWHEQLQPWFDPSATARSDEQLLRAPPKSASGWTQLLYPLPVAAHAAPSAAGPRATRSATSASSSDSRLEYRVCHSLAEAIHSGHPLRAIFLPNLMWYSPCGPLVSLRERLSLLCSTVQQRQGGLSVSVYPPSQWDDELEMKDTVYNTFRSVMLPSVVASIQTWNPFETGLLATANALVQQCPQGGLYVLKGCYGDCARAVVPGISLVSHNGGSAACAPPALVAAMRRLVIDLKQHTFMLQKHVPNLRLHEYRMWYMALPAAPNGPRVFRMVAMVHTTYSAATPPALTALPSSPLDPQSCACFDLAQRIMLGNEHVFSQLRARLLAMGCFALRVDCGFDPDTQTAFLNELTAPADAAIFTFIHETELVLSLGTMLAEGLFPLLRISPHSAAV